MPGLRLLLTGPPRRLLRNEAIERASQWAASTRHTQSVIWIAPSLLARDQIARDLALQPRSSFRPAPQVWCWDQIWSSLTVSLADIPPPARLSPAGVRGVLAEAIQRGRETDILGPLGAAVDQSGWQRRTLNQFASWIRNERSPTGPPPGKGRAEVAQWALFGLFNETLIDIQARTPEGWANWASRRLSEAPPSPWHDLSRTLIVVVEPVAPPPAVRRVLDAWNGRAGGLIVTLPYDPEPTLSEVYAAIEPTRRYFIDLGFSAESIVDPSSPTVLGHELFRTDAHRRPPLSDAGLQVLGGPQGDGQALLIAERVRAALDSGVNPDDILILVPREDDDVATIRSVLASWQIPVAPGPTRRLSTSPAVAALRLVLRLSVEDWEVATLTRLLRHNAVAWDRFGLGDPLRRFEIAAAITATRVYRNLNRLRNTLNRNIAERRSKAQGDTDTLADRAIDQLFKAVSPSIRSVPWRVHGDQLQNLARNLGLDPVELAPLWDALGDQGWVLDQVGPAIAALPIRWPDFVASVERIIAEAEPQPHHPSAEAGTVRVAVVGTVDGARADLLILANLAEKTFPTPDSVPQAQSRPVEPLSVQAELPLEAEILADPVDPIAVDVTAERQTDLSYARELLRFTRAVAAADGSLMLTWPTTDSSGAGLLPAGFLDEVFRRLDPTTEVVATHARFDPVLRGHEALAEAPGDRRVLAVAQACVGEMDLLQTLAAHPSHASALRGVAEAFRVGHLRRERFDFNAHDGWLMDTDAVAQVAATFGTEHSFSPSQLESYAYCPFQFFQRYVLKLKPTDGFEELAEDYVGRGKDVHRILEEVHKVMIAEGSTDLATQLPILIQTKMTTELARFDYESPSGEADVAEVLREIDTRRSGKALDRYLAQFQAYSAKVGVGAIPHRFEVRFGQDEQDSLNPLILGDAGEQIKLQGVIDRIDLVEAGGATRFRVIDYKTGSNPSPADVKSGLASQLPLYAMAVEELVLPAGTTEFLDAGYWSLPRDGYKGVKLEAWADYRAAMTEFVLAMVRELRRGVFPIASQEAKCTQFCDFHKTCRVGEVRSARKAWNDRPTLEVGKP